MICIAKGRLHSLKILSNSFPIQYDLQSLLNPYIICIALYFLPVTEQHAAVLVTLKLSIVKVIQFGHPTSYGLTYQRSKRMDSQ